MFVDPRRLLAGSASTASPLTEADIRATLSDAAVLATLSSPDASTSAINSALAALAQKLRDSPPGLPLDAFLACGRPIIDVRAPCEYARGHIPGALSLPLFDDAGRAEVGTSYSHAGREAAMALGMRLVAPRLAELVAAARRAGETVAVHCWRGGLRSGAVAWLLRQHGLDVVTLDGGYRAFRRWVLVGLWGGLRLPPRKPPRVRGLVRKGAGAAAAAAEQAAAEAAAAAAAPPTVGGLPATLVAAVRALPGPRVCVIGGRTGVGKTRVLHALRRLGARVIDLEGLAHHRGSAFGWCGNPEQPSNELFANRVAMAWREAAMAAAGGGGDGGGGAAPARGWVFLEDEDSHIGACETPPGVYAALRCAPLVVRLAVGQRARLALLVEDYASPEVRAGGAGGVEGWEQRMEESIRKLGKRLGGERVGALLEALRGGDYEEVGRALLGYYDALYDKHLLNGTGQGSGDGARPGAVLEAAQPDDAPALDDAELAREVLRRVAEFEAAEAAAPPKLAPEVGASEVAPPEAEEEGGEQALCAFQ